MTRLVVYDAGEGYPAVGDLVGPDCLQTDGAVYEVTEIVPGGIRQGVGHQLDTMHVEGKVRPDVDLYSDPAVNPCYIRVEEDDGQDSER